MFGYIYAHNALHLSPRFPTFKIRIYKIKLYICSCTLPFDNV